MLWFYGKIIIGLLIIIFIYKTLIFNSIYILLQFGFSIKTDEPNGIKLGNHNHE